jgi:hypothetical protein
LIELYETKTVKDVVIIESKKSILKKSKECIGLKLFSRKKLVTRISTGIINGNINTGANIALAFKLNVSEATIKQMLKMIGVPMSIEKNSKTILGSSIP